MKTPSIKDYFLSARPQFLPASAIPVGLGAAIAWRVSHSFDPFLFILSLMAAVLFHGGMNVLNDFFDFKNGTDNINKGALTPFTGGSRFIQRGIMTPGDTLVFGLILLSIGSAAGLYLAVKTGPALLIIGAIGLFSGVFYSAPPLFLAGRGLGELTVALDFGVLPVIGSYMVQGKGADLEALLYGVPVSFLIAALLFINEFPDHAADKASGKRTLVVRLGPEKARYALALVILSAYFSLAAAVFSGHMRPQAMAGLIPAVLAIPAIKGLFRHYAGGAPLVPPIKSVILSHMLTGVLLIASNFI